MRLIRLVWASIALTILASAGLAQSDYQIRPGDTLQIEVLEDASLNRATVVLPDGRFSFPFAGTLTASGRTIDQVKNQLTSAIAPNFANAPNVFVSVVPGERAPVSKGGARTIDIYFVGEIGAPGLKELRPRTSILQALAVSGGFTKFAATKRIQLRRTDKRSGRQQVFSFNYRAVTQGSAAQDIPLQDGDVIIVPQRRLFE